MLRRGGWFQTKKKGFIHMKNSQKILNDKQIQVKEEALSREL